MGTDKINRMGMDSYINYFYRNNKINQIIDGKPSTSVSCERSFSMLRRLKTWLRSQSTQQKINILAICNEHQDILDSIDDNKLTKEFCQINNFRKHFVNII